MSADEKYVGVTVILRRLTAKAALVSPSAAPEHEAWVPRSCIHGADDSALDAVALGDEIALRMFQWIAQKNGLT